MTLTTCIETSVVRLLMTLSQAAISADVMDMLIQLEVRPQQRFLRDSVGTRGLLRIGQGNGNTI